MRTILTSFFLLLALSISAQPLEDAMKAFGQGDAEKITSWIDRDVELSISGNVDYYTKSQAVSKLKSFFSKYPPKSITEVHRGSSKNEDSRFLIAHLQTGSGKFRVYLYGVQKDSKFSLEEIRIEKE